MHWLPLVHWGRSSALTGPQKLLPLGLQAYKLG